MVSKFSIITFGLVDNWKLPLLVNLFSVPDGFVTVTVSSQVLAVDIKFVSFISVVVAPKPYFVSVK